MVYVEVQGQGRIEVVDMEGRVDPAAFYHTLYSNGYEFYTGVPDSILGPFARYLCDYAGSSNHVIAPNEGLAVSLAAGYHLATGKIPVVYMSNSGLGNAWDPMVSLASDSMYGIPMLVLVGWRGRPLYEDAIQHQQSGKFTVQVIDTVSGEGLLHLRPNHVDATLVVMKKMLRARPSPKFLLIPPESFNEYDSINSDDRLNCELSLQDAMHIILEHLTYLPDRDRDFCIVASTGHISRVLNHIGGHIADKCFLNVGAMGHASSIALGIAMQRPDTDVWIFDGDGAALMHLGAISMIGSAKGCRVNHVIFDNRAHNSVGVECPAAPFRSVALNAGYDKVYSACTGVSLRDAVEDTSKDPVSLIQVIVNRDVPDTPRPSTTPVERKCSFMNRLV